MKGAYKRAGEELLAKVCSDRTRGIGFKLKEGRFRFRNKKEIIFYGSGETLAQIAQGSCGCPLPGSVPGQVGWGFIQPGLGEDVPARDKGVETR